jgi:hypothetical protein
VCLCACARATGELQPLLEEAGVKNDNFGEYSGCLLFLFLLVLELVF